MLHIHQLNLQSAVGGGEVYTRWFTRALADAGAKVTLYVSRSNPFWAGLESTRVQVVPVGSGAEIARHLPRDRCVLVTQSRLPASLRDIAEKAHVLTGFAHMPMHGRDASEFESYATVFTVSKYCIDLLKAAGIEHVYPEPLYGTFALDPARIGASHAASIRARSPYHWDKRKGRDRFLSIVEPLGSLMPGKKFVRKPGLTLGIVSLLSPIKQFPELFSCIAGQISMFPAVNLEIFGSGGYAQVRDLRRALEPIRRQVRFWGYQQAVHAVYPQLDYLLTGLPEKEALGLNVLEAQAAGTPVLAPHAPPFTETIVHGQSGFLYRDPREDSGHDFGVLLARLAGGTPRPDPRLAADHLAKFSYAALVERAVKVIDHLTRLQATRSHDNG